MPRNKRPFVFLASLVNTAIFISAFATFFFIAVIFQEIQEYIDFIPVYMLFYTLAFLNVPAIVLGFLGTLSCNGRPGIFRLGNVALVLIIIWDFFLFSIGALFMLVFGVWRGTWTFENILYWGKYAAIAILLIIALVAEAHRASKQEDREFSEKYEPKVEIEPVIAEEKEEVPVVQPLPHQEAFDALKSRLQMAHERYLKQELTKDAYRETKRLLLLDYEMSKHLPSEEPTKGSATI